MKHAAVLSAIALTCAGCTETGSSMRQRKSDFVIETEELMHDVYVNRLEPNKLDAKYKGKVVEVRDAMLFNEPGVDEKGNILLLATWVPRETGWYVSCHVIPSENGTLTKFRKHDRIHLKGKYSKVQLGSSSNFFGIEDCIAVE